MTAAIAPKKGQFDRAEQLEHLRRQIAAVSGKVGLRRHVEERPAELFAEF